jgi:carboxypeptidase Q
MYEPRPVPTKLGLIGMGGSVSGNVKAEVVVVKDYDELDKLGDKVKGKIVCYNNKWTTYGQTVTYRSRGAIAAAKYGAVGVLIRSVAPDSVYSAHTGITHYDDSVTKIPIAAITLEDADMFQRMQDRKQKIVVHFILENKSTNGANSNNLVFEIKGSEKPDEIILAGGHIDSWDTGSQTGANDDGGGFITVFEALRLLLKNGLRPKRTLRFIAWSG